MSAASLPLVLVPLLVSLVVVAGCRTSSSAAEAPAPGHDGRLRAHAYDCADGPSFTIRNLEGGDLDVALPADRQRLRSERAASGARYSGSRMSVWTKGDEALLELGGRTYRCTLNRPRSILEDAAVRGVELRATGNEPGWVFELFPERMAFVGDYGARSAITPRPVAIVDAATGETILTAITEAHRLEVRIRPRACVDSMSGDRYERELVVELDGKEYRGCGQPLR